MTRTIKKWRYYLDGKIIKKKSTKLVSVKPIISMRMAGYSPEGIQF
jgi:hypothetical protein